MHPSNRWRAVVPVILLVVLAGCAISRPEAVHAGAPTETTARAVGTPASSTTLPTTPTSTVASTAAAVTSSTTSAAPTASGPSPVDGVSAVDLRAVVGAPAPAGKQASSSPMAQAVRLLNGTTVWRVRIPGRFPVRSARVVVSVGGRRIGDGMVGPRLGSLVAVTRSPDGLVAGATVTYQWGGSAPVVAGRLVVAR